MNNHLQVLGINLIKADEEHKAAIQAFLDASDKLREAMQKEDQYWVVVNNRLLRWRDGIVQIE